MKINPRVCKWFREVWNTDTSKMSRMFSPARQQYLEESSTGTFMEVIQLTHEVNLKKRFIFILRCKWGNNRLLGLIFMRTQLNWQSTTLPRLRLRVRAPLSAQVLSKRITITEIAQRWVVTTVVECDVICNIPPFLYLFLYCMLR